MKIQLNTDVNIDGTEALAAQVSATVEQALERFAEGLAPRRFRAWRRTLRLCHRNQKHLRMWRRTQPSHLRSVSFALQ